MLIDRLRPLLSETSQTVYLLHRQSKDDVLVIHDKVVWLIVSEQNPRTPKHEFSVTEWQDRFSTLPAKHHHLSDECGMKAWIIGKLRGLA